MAFRSSFHPPRASPMQSSQFPIWKVKPPGPEQLELERMFAENEIDGSFSADSVRKSKDMFRKFSAQVFVTHFRSTKAKLGLAASIPPENVKIDELGGTSKKIVAKTQQELDWEENHPTFDPADDPIVYQSPPYATWMYTDFERKVDFVCVVVPIVSGSKNVDFSLSADGTQLDICYTWPEVVFDATVLFEDAIKKKKLSLKDPQVHAFCAEMIDKGRTKKSAPKGRITVNLPCKVMRQASTWTKNALPSTNALTGNDTQYAFLEFTAFQKEVFIEDADTSLNF